jgi:hypothetical protein
VPYDARVIQVLIASPGDVVAERAIAAEVIHEWNSINARERRVVLVPLRWETDATPEMGDRTQAIINRQIVDQCDLVVGMFWTRLGTPTGVAQSGTAEELDRAGRAGKRTLLYFSKVPVDLETVDLDEYHRLNEFKTRTYPNGLVEKYASVTDFRQKLVRHLASAVMKLIADDASAASRSTRPSGVRLSAAFIGGQPMRVVDEQNPLMLRRIVCVDEMDIPDFVTSDGSELRADGMPLDEKTVSLDFYRRLVRFQTDESSIAPLWLAVTNEGDTAFRDIHMEMSARVTSGSVNVRMTRPYHPSRLRRNFGADTVWANQPAELIVGRQDGDEWLMQLDLPVVQAGRTIAAREALSLQVMDDASLLVTATVYSSVAPPFTLEIPLALRVELQEMTYLDLLSELEPAAATELISMNRPSQP